MAREIARQAAMIGYLNAFMRLLFVISVRRCPSAAARA
jgi:hypothetical protein